MANDDKALNSKKDTHSSQPGVPLKNKNIPEWVLYGWGILTLMIAILFILSFVLKPNTDINPTKTVSQHSHNIFPQQIVWLENFDQCLLEGWTQDWVNLRETDDGSGKILLAYRNMESDKQSKIKFTPLNKENRAYYAKSPKIPVDFGKEYWISFDFHGKGPIELLDFGHIRLRLLDDMESLSYDPDGVQSYRTFNLSSENLSSLQQEKYSFKINVDPNSHNYEIWINGKSIGRIHYSDQIRPLDQVFFRELSPVTGEPVVNAVFYDNFQIYGTPTQSIHLASTNTTILVTTISEEYKLYYRAGWDKYNSRDFSGAVQAFQKAINENPKSAEAYNGLGLAYVYSGDTQSAWKAWLQALSIDSSYEPARQNLGFK